MSKMRNNTLKVMVLIALLCSTAFADGEMGGGGLSDTGIDTRNGKPVITITTEDGEMGGGGRLADFGSLIASIYDYFDKMI